MSARSNAIPESSSRAVCGGSLARFARIQSGGILPGSISSELKQP